MSLEKIEKHLETMSRAESAIRRLLIGKQATILSDYNGQPHGRSRPSMRGKVITIQSVIVDQDVWLCPGGQRACLELDEVKVHWKR